MIIDKFFKLLLIIYPSILLWNPEEFTIINQAIGVSFIGLYFLRISLIKKDTISKLDVSIISFSLIILLSIIANNSFNFINVSISLKYLTSLMIGAYALNYTNVSFLNYFFKFYFWIFLSAWLIRFIQFGLPFNNVTAIRGELWWGKAVLFGFLYAAFYFGYLFFLKSSNKNLSKRKYLLSIPLLLMGSRSVLIGTLLMLFIYVLVDLRISPKKIRAGLFGLLGIAAISYSFLFEYILENKLLKQTLSSERDLNVGGDVTLSTFSSGRTNIWNAYIDNFTITDLLLGHGGINLNIGFSLHNDFLEVFFFYGIFALILFLVLIYKIYLKEGFKSTNPLRIAIFFFLLLQFFFNPFSSTMSATFFIILLLNYDCGKISIQS